MSRPKTAAFFRAEGILVSIGVVGAAAYMAANRAGFRERTFRFAQALLAAPLHGLIGQNDRTMGNRLVHLAYRHMTEDRISVLAEEYVEDVLKEKVFERGLELVRRAKKEGHRIVLLAEGISQVWEPFAAHLGVVDDLVCNHLEFREGRATGRLLDPVVGGHEGGRWIREYAVRNDLDLEASVAYGACGPDLLLLASVGKACAVNPDYTLRRAAQEADWPLIEYRE